MNSLEENLPHEVSEVICLKCLKRWIAVYPERTLLKDLECTCGQVDYVIKTGQTLIDNECDRCQNYKTGKCTLGLSSNSEVYCGYFRNI